MKSYHVIIDFGVLILVPAESRDEAKEKADQHPLIKKLTAISGVWYDGSWVTELADNPYCANCGVRESGSLIWNEEEWICITCAKL